MIIGFSGSGKSTLAKRLSDHYEIPVLYLDTLNFAPNWVERPREVRNQDLIDFLDTHDSWVIDGNYTGAVFERRLEEADQIFFLDFNRFVCFKNAFLRYYNYRNKSRDSMTIGCNEKLDFEFIKWLLWAGRTKTKRRKYLDSCAIYSNKATRFTTREALNEYLSKNHI